MRILCLGAGAIGGFFGARLIEGGADVTFLVRPNRQKALAEHGLRLESPSGNFSRPVKTVAAVQGEAFDYIVLTCKAYDLSSAMAAIAPAVGQRHRDRAAAERGRPYRSLE